MILIAHRGNTNGPYPSRENSPEYIKEALEQGYDVEVDVRFINGEWYLGHDLDGLKYRTYIQFLQNPGLWIHAKNIEALRILIDSRARTFWHDHDEMTLTSDNYIWGFSGGTNKSIIVVQDNSIPIEKCAGVCSDYVEKIKNSL